MPRLYMLVMTAPRINMSLFFNCRTDDLTIWPFHRSQRELVAVPTDTLAATRQQVRTVVEMDPRAT